MSGVLAQPGGVFGERHALTPVFGRAFGQNADAAGGAERVHHFDLHVVVLLPQVLYGAERRLIGRAQTAREAQHQQRCAGLDVLAEDTEILKRRHLAGLGLHFVAQRLVKVVAFRVVLRFFAFDMLLAQVVGHGDEFDAVPLRRSQINVDRHIRENFIVHDSPRLFKEYVFLHSGIILDNSGNCKYEIAEIQNA